MELFIMFILVILQYDYANNLGGRRTGIGKPGTMMAQSETQAYGYNVRDELISGQGLTYNYDAIGNRTIAEGKMYTANELNQYTAIDSFTPQYDADGNQTLIKTSTGIWSVTYNAENRPVRWELGDTVVTMDFDRMGRRTFYKEMNGNTQVTFTRFVYKDYLCVRQVFSNSPYNTYKNFVWDPTETIATRPLKLQLPTMSLNLFYMHDGNKNVSDVVYRLTSNGVAAHYDYAPFGAVTRSVSNAVPTADITTLNPFRFSSEYHDDTLGLVYYNYRHYNPTAGRWTSRDPEFEKDSYLHSKNTPINLQDVRGLWVLSVGFNFSGSLLGGGTISFGIAISYDKNVGIEVATYASPGIGASAGIPAGSVGVQIQYSDDATTTDNLSGEACVMGGSAGAGLAIGIDESFPVEVESGYKFISVTLGLGTPKAEGHIFCTKTVVWKYKFTDCKIEEGEYNSYELINAPPGFYLGVM